jgi:hypothetical protein
MFHLLLQLPERAVAAQGPDADAPRAHDREKQPVALIGVARHGLGPVIAVHAAWRRVVLGVRVPQPQVGHRAVLNLPALARQGFVPAGAEEAEAAAAVAVLRRGDLVHDDVVGVQQVAPQQHAAGLGMPARPGHAPDQEGPAVVLRHEGSCGH